MQDSHRNLILSNERAQRAWLLLGWASWWLLALWPLAGHWATNPQYAYGWLVAPLALLLAKRRWQVRPDPAQPPPWSKIVVIAAAALVLPSWLIAQPNPGWRLVPTMLALSAAAGSVGLCSMLGGRNWARHFAFPIFFVLTAVPWPGLIEEPLVQGLMRFVAGCTVTLLNFAGYPAVQRGSLVEIVGGVLGVDEACSGVRSLQATLMAALFLGEWHRLRTGARFGLVAAGFATAILTNIARTSFLSFSAARGGMSAANQFHDPAGYTVLTVCLVIVALIAEWLRVRYGAPARSASASQQPPHRVSLAPALCVWLMTVFVATEVWYFRDLGKVIATWTLIPPPDAKPEKLPRATLDLLGCDRTTAARWRDEASREWTLFFLEWFPSRSRTALLAQVHRPEICLPSIGLVETGERREVRIAVDGFDLAFESMHFRDPRGADVFVFYCPWEIVPGVGGRNAAFSDATRAASLRRVWKRERVLGQQVAEFIVSGESSRTAVEDALRKQLKRLIQPAAGATPKSDADFKIDKSPASAVRPPAGIHRIDAAPTPASLPAMSPASAMLEIPAVRARVSPVAVAQYHQFPEFNENGRRTELIRGVVIEKMPKAPLHASIAKLLYDSLNATVPAGFSVRQHQPLTLRDSEPEPDIAIVRGSVQYYWTSHPATASLVIEIAVSTATFDREKAALVWLS